MVTDGVAHEPPRLFLLLLQSMNTNLKAHLALFITTIIFGFHYVIAKNLMPVHLDPMQLIFLRMLGGVVIFWVFQRLFVPEKVERRDLVYLAICGLFGFAANQAFFYEGLNLTTPVDASLIHVLNPVLVLIFASTIIREKITGIKLGGIILGAAGALILILYGRMSNVGTSTMTGNILVILNMVFYALYLVLIKPLVARYHTSTILKWVSFFGFIFLVPFSVKPMMGFHFSQMTLQVWLSLAYIIFLNTFLAYLLINFALKHVTATTVSYYTYLQPVLAAVTSVSIGIGTVTIPKVIAALLIFTGVFFVNRKS